MNMTPELEALRQRNAPLDMLPGEFREIGHRLVVTKRWRLVARMLKALPERLYQRL